VPDLLDAGEAAAALDRFGPPYVVKDDGWPPARACW
jgi:hypothetical protein